MFAKQLVEIVSKGGNTTTMDMLRHVIGALHTHRNHDEQLEDEHWWEDPIFSLMVMLCATFIALHGWGNIHSIVIAFIVLMAVVLGCASVAARWLLGRRSKLVDAGLARIIAEDRLQLQIEPLAEGETNAKDRAVVVMVQSEIAVVEVTNRLADAAEKSGTFTRSSSARHRAALRAAGDVRMPPHVEMALRSSRLTLSNARYQKIRTLTLDYLVWAVDQADDELVDLFWKRAQKPVFAAILVFALAAQERTS